MSFIVKRIVSREKDYFLIDEGDDNVRPKMGEVQISTKIDGTDIEQAFKDGRFKINWAINELHEDPIGG